MNRTLLKELKEIKNVNVIENEPLANHTTWKIGGPADLMVLPYSKGALVACLKLLDNKKKIILGGGSNLLFHDNGIRGVVIKIVHNFSKIRITSKNNIYVESGCYVPCFAKYCLDHGLIGLEHIIGIPGTMGGLIVMNGGSNRKSISDNLSSLEILNNNGEINEIQKDACDFKYRHSIFQKNSDIILSAKFHLDLGDATASRREMLEILEMRRNKFPRKLASCGSVFKSDPNMYLQFGSPGKIIEDMGLKGLTIGGACVSKKHANFIINYCRASHHDVIDLVRYIKKTACTKLGIDLVAEAKFVDTNCRILPLHEV